MSHDEKASTQKKDKKGAAVKFPPPLIFLIIMAVTFGINYLHPLTIGEAPFIGMLGKLFLLLSILILVYALYLFIKAKTHIEPWRPTSSIITSGLFAYSRNPIYFAFCTLTIGISIVLNNLWMLLGVIPSAYLVFIIAIKKEEQYLEKKFGDEYLEYKNKVRRWI